MNGLSFIIPSVGKSDKLDTLINQINLISFKKEIILVDNSSNKLLSKKYSKSKKCKYVYENKSGTSFARNKGANEAKYNMLVFLDDDIVLSSDFQNLDFNQLYDDKSCGIAGGKVIVNNIPSYLPKKYFYIAGVKDYGDNLLNLPKYKYLGGCLLIIKKEVFNKVNGFDTDFGHNKKIKGANEDIIIQELVRKIGLKVMYMPKATVYHFWNEDEKYAIERVRTQGIVDRITDKKYFSFRFLLKLIKYKLFIFIYNNKTNLPKEKLYDLERYKSYVNSK